MVANVLSAKAVIHSTGLSHSAFAAVCQLVWSHDD